MTESYHGLDVVDYIILSTLLLISASIGVYYRFSGGKQRTTKEYLLADRNMSFIPVAFSLMASFMSSITLLGVSSENYVYGTQFVVINLAYIIGTPLAAYFYLPVFYKLQNASVYKYLELRFGVATRLVASIAFITQMILYIGIVLYAPAIALNAVTGLNKIASIIAVGVVCTFYSTIGGMKAVLITDVFQSVLMFASVICVGIKGSIDAGGIDKVWEIANEGGRIQFSDLRIDPSVRHTLWTQLIGGIFTFTSLYAVNQTQVQRLLTVNSLRKAQRSLWLNWPILTALSLTTSYAGISMYSHYANCDPLLEKHIRSPDQLLPYFVVDTMGHLPGVAGLFIAGIFSGSLSTVSSALNSLAAVTVQDFLVPCCFQKTSDSRLTWVTQIVALTYGGISIAIAFVAEYLGGVLQASLTIFGVVGGPLLALFTVGMFSTVVEQKGALAGLISGLAFSLWVGFGGPKPPIPRLSQRNDGCSALLNATSDSLTDLYLSTVSTSPLPTLPSTTDDYFPLYRISYMWYAPLGFLMTILVAQVVSRIVNAYLLSRGTSNKKINEELFSPMFPKCFRTAHHLPDPILLLTTGNETGEEKQCEEQSVMNI
uniref:Sodium-dependent multivitamin transporter n=1 Tax=Daphnia galeata TaxID=27404 RepID=A0A8J2WRA3_9CRUS|nr:unnamed protein product [Daphnia galeata]